VSDHIISKLHAKNVHLEHERQCVDANATCQQHSLLMRCFSSSTLRYWYSRFAPEALSTHTTYESQPGWGLGVSQWFSEGRWKCETENCRTG